MTKLSESFCDNPEKTLQKIGVCLERLVPLPDGPVRTCQITQPTKCLLFPLF